MAQAEAVNDQDGCVGRAGGPVAGPGRDSNLHRGLRGVSIRLCQLLQDKGKTSCAAVADELAYEYGMENASGTRGMSATPEKNIRRRIYDALNVLISAGVFEKTEGGSGSGGAMVQWRGLPRDIHVAALEAQHHQAKRRLQEKHEQVRQLQRKQQAFLALLARNRQPEYRDSKRARISMPFVAVSAAADTSIRVDKQEKGGRSEPEEVVFEFGGKFSLMDDSELLDRLVQSGALECGNMPDEDGESPQPEARRSTAVPDEIQTSD